MKCYIAGQLLFIDCTYLWICTYFIQLFFSFCINFYPIMLLYVPLVVLWGQRLFFKLNKVELQIEGLVVALLVGYITKVSLTLTSWLFIGHC